jgi:hypothetical protein
MDSLRDQRGLSLVEVTIMLLVLMLLTGVLAPQVMDFVDDARWVKVKEDCEAIGVSVSRLTRDVGPCLKFNGAAGCDESNRVDILYSDGPDVTAANVTVPAFSSSNLTPSAINWDNDSDALVGDRLEAQLASNAPLYPTPLQNYPAPSTPVGPLFGLGWRGGYVTPPVGADPWGHRYLVNAAFLAVAADSAAATEEGGSSRWWERDV